MTKTDPLVTDEQIKAIRNAKFSETVPIFEVRDIYEADRAALLKERDEALRQLKRNSDGWHDATMLGAKYEDKYNRLKEKYDALVNTPKK